jgi:YbbR domain-containing protein
LAKIGSITVTPSLEDLEAGKELSLPVRFAQSKPFEDADQILPEPRSVNVNAALVTGQPRKKVEVDARLSGKPDDDYALRSVMMEPAEVMIQGETSALEKISTVETETVDISGLKANQTMVVPLRELSGGVTMVDTQSVRLIIRLEPISAQRMISDLPVTLANLDPKNTRQNREWRIDPPAVSVTVEAAPSVITQDPASPDVNVFVDMSNIFLRKTLLPVRAVVSDDRFKVVDIDPSSVTVTDVEK